MNSILRNGIAGNANLPPRPAWNLGLALILVAVLAAGGVGLAHAFGVSSGTSSGAAPSASEAKPFAQHHLVLQLSDADPKKQALVLSVANNLLKAYGPDNIAIDVVVFADGVRLLYANSPRRVMVDSLVAQGVRFDVCMNTINTIRRKTGHVPRLNPHAHPVAAGVARILELSEKGYTVVRP